jgi:hypothetical protein
MDNERPRYEELRIEHADLLREHGEVAPPQASRSCAWKPGEPGARRGHRRPPPRPWRALDEARGARFFQVKTLAQTHSSPEYAETRAFYQRMGYLPLQLFPELWSAAAPCLQLLKAAEYE